MEIIPVFSEPINASELRLLSPYRKPFELERIPTGLSGHLRERFPDNLLCGDVHHETRLKEFALAPKP